MFWPITIHVSCHKSFLFGKGEVLRKDKTDTTDICLTQCRAQTKCEENIHATLIAGLYIFFQ